MKTFITRRFGGGPGLKEVQVQGFAVKFKRATWATGWFVYKVTPWEWVCIESTSGSGGGRARTRREAIEKTERKLLEYGPETLARNIKETLALHKLKPLVQP